MKLKAFTLAEVLITLGIIGVIAAMTLPSLLNNSRKKELETGLKKNYTVIQQALMMYHAKNGTLLKPQDTGLQRDSNSLYALIKPYFYILHDCGLSHINGCMPLPDDADSNERVSYLYKTYNNKTMTLGYLDDGQFVLKDGSLILIENPGSTADGNFRCISVDVNGFNKKPNRWGHDLFTFQLMDDGKLLPMGASGTKFSDKSEFCSTTSSSNINGIGCTYYALTDKDYFKNLPK